MPKELPHTFLLGTQVYPLMQWYSARGSTLEQNLPEAFGWIAAAGLTAVEAFAESAESIDRVRDAAAAAGLKVPSLYLNVRLHEDDWRGKAESAVALAIAAKQKLDARILTVNPEPIRWGSPDDKDDAMLRRQAGALRWMHDTLRTAGITLAYHTHDPEMRQGAREFHHMMVATMDKPMGWCLDTHWIYRGCGNSNVALEDAVRLYGRRIKALHLRQSAGGIWTETFCEGDVDHWSWVKQLRDMRFTGPVYLEQAVETGTPQTLSMPERLKASADALKKLLS
jgi:inosose dehydratase